MISSTKSHYLIVCLLTYFKFRFLKHFFCLSKLFWKVTKHLASNFKILTRNGRNNTLRFVFYCHVTFQPPASYKNHLIDASNYHTVSDVSFGNGKQKFYTTTIQENFPPRENVYKKRHINTCASDIPFDYYGMLTMFYFYNLIFYNHKRQSLAIFQLNVLKNFIKIES